MNYLVKDAKMSAKAATRRSYHELRIMLEKSGWGIFAIGVIVWVVERVWLINALERDTFTWLAYLYNPLMMVGAALIGACAFQYASKRNSEIERIAAINDELYGIHVKRLDLIGARHEKVIELPPARSS
jgi:hypothetical protein